MTEDLLALAPWAVSQQEDHWDQITEKLFAQFWVKVAKAVEKAKSAKIFMPNHNLKVQNINIKPLSKPKNTVNKPSFESLPYNYQLTIQLVAYHTSALPYN